MRFYIINFGIMLVFHNEGIILFFSSSYASTPINGIEVDSIKNTIRSI